AAPRPARRLADRAPLRRGHDRGRCNGPREGVRRRRRAAAGILSESAPARDRGGTKAPAALHPRTMDLLTNGRLLWVSGSADRASRKRKEERMKTRFVSVLVMLAVVALAGGAVAQQPQPAETFNAFAVSMQAGGGAAITIVINRWSTDAEQNLL